MNKLTALYAVMKNMKDSKKFSGKATGEIKFGDVVLATMNMDAACEDGKCTKKKEIRFGEETIKFEHSGNSKEKNFGHHGKCCGGSKLGKAMMMLKMLDKLNYEELPSGHKLLSLEIEMADLPEEMQAHMKQKRAHLANLMSKCKNGGSQCETSPSASCCDKKSECCEGFHDKAKEWLQINGVFDVNPETIEIGAHSIKLEIDGQGKPVEMNIDFKASGVLNSGEKKDLRILMNGKML